MTVGTELLITAEPHLIPGYTGYCPQYRFKHGATYAKTTHKLLLDPTVDHANTLILSNRATDDCKAWRPPKNDINVVNIRVKRTDPVFVHPMIPGYEGFIPGLSTRIGQRYTVLATEGLADFERQQLRAKENLNRLKKTIDVQSGRFEPRNLEERLVREKSDDIYLATGYATHGSKHFGKSIVSSSDNLSCDFASYLMGQNIKYEIFACPDPPLLIHPSEIYHKHVGMIPNYVGHIPGAIFRCGKTFGTDTIDAKKWLQGDSALN
ncbi:UPF0605 protein GA14893-like [Nylanderia fulva]|uniref:UPF0605 protein GA14893-like n=1 Tax=Nylanderia fulva TaxID=613905 RepID=UPI0010FB6B7B|nr:UPF0605 protein GA14893-like [Nylanderia fulva]